MKKAVKLAPVSTRVIPDDKDLIKSICKKRNIKVSAFLRDLISTHLIQFYND